MNIKDRLRLRCSVKASLMVSMLTYGGAASAQLVSYPAPPMTVADCRGTDTWQKRADTGLAYCQEYIPPPPPPPPPSPPPPPPSCRYQAGAFLIHVGDMGQCSADGGCEGKGYAIYYGGLVASEMWVGYMEWSELNARASAAVAARGYRFGAYITGGISNGNNMGYSVTEVCR